MFPVRDFPGGTDPSCEMWEGARHWGVVALQDMLVRCYHQDIAVDGIFGPRTRAALVNAQAWAKYAEGQKDLVVDGIYGPRTRDAVYWPQYDGNTFVTCSRRPL